MTPGAGKDQGKGIVREFGMVMYTRISLKWITNKDLLTVQHTGLCSMSRGSLDGRGVGGRMDTCICMVESLLCSFEGITTLLIGYTPI